MEQKKGVKIAVPLKYLSNFRRSLEMLLINCKVELSLNWIENCVLTSAPIGDNVNATGADSTTFKITDAKLYLKLLDSSYQGVKQLFVLAYNNTEGNNQVAIYSFKKNFPPRVKIENYNMEIDGRNFYNQPINDSIKQYDEIRKVSTGQGDDYTTGCLLDFAYFEKNYKLIAADLSKQKALDSDSRTIQQIIFTAKITAAANITRVIIHYNQNKQYYNFLKERQKSCN